jgi:uncharacterized protein YjbJ (UPF0337 family)
MSCHRLIGNWPQGKGAAGEGWGKLTDNNGDAIAGKRDILPGKVQEEHSNACEQAEKEFKDCEASLK